MLRLKGVGQTLLGLAIFSEKKGRPFRGLLVFAGKPTNQEGILRVPLKNMGYASLGEPRWLSFEGQPKGRQPNFTQPQMLPEATKHVWGHMAIRCALVWA